MASHWSTRKALGSVQCELAGYVNAAMCDAEDCHTWLFWHAPGGEGDGQVFQAKKTCDCDYQHMVCSKHKDTFVCTEDEDEEESSPKRTAN